MANSKDRLTAVNRKGFAVLKNPLQMEKAIGRLHEYEETGLTPREVHLLLSRVNAMAEHIKRLEEW